jgi:hypothetical protein
MADPLTQTVEQFAPAPLNIFDQGQAETLMSRYAGARDVAENRQRLAEEDRRAQQARREELMAERQQLLNTREDEAYRMKKDAEAQRGAFLADALETLKPKDTGYYEREVEFLRKAPPAILNDPVTRDILSGFKTLADREEEKRTKEAETKQRQQNTLEGIRERAKYSETMKYLTQDDLAKLPKDENGSVDTFAMGILAGQRKREAEEKEAAAKLEGQKELIDRRSMSAEQKKEDDDLKDVIIQDSNAFPRRETLVLKKAAAAGKSPKIESVKKELAEAKEWDKNIFEKEILAARDFNNAEEYVNLLDKTYADMGIEMPDSAKQNRRLLWNYAQKYKPRQSGVAAPAAPAPATPAAPAPATPAAPTRTVTKQYVEGDYAVREFSDGSKQRKKIK